MTGPAGAPAGTPAVGTPLPGARPVPSARRSAIGMAAGTLASRLTGLARTAAVAAVLGVTTLGDAFNAASIVPTMLLVLVTGGTLSAVLVPMFARAGDPVERRRLAEGTGALVLAVSLLAASLAAVTAPGLARLFALRVDAGGDYTSFVTAAAVLLAVFAPQVAGYGVSVWASAVLNAEGRLTLAGFAPVLANLLTLAGVGGYVALADGEGRVPALALAVLGAGNTFGVLLSAAVQYAGARRLLPGLRLRLRRPRRGDPVVRRVAALGRWTALYAGVNQLGLVAVTVLAAGVGGGGAVAAYQWAFTIMQMPYAVLAVSLLSALYPRLSRADGPRFAALSAEGLRVTLTLLVPAAVALGLLARPVSRVLLGYGAVSADGVDLIAVAVRAFAAALVPFTVFQLLTRSHYALADTRTPALVNIAVNAVNVVAAVVAVLLPVGTAGQLAGLVAAYLLSYLTGCLLLGRALVRRAPGAFAGGGRAAARSLAAAAGLAGPLLLADALLPPADTALATAGRVAVLLAVGGAGWLLTLALLRDPALRLTRRRPPARRDDS